MFYKKFKDSEDVVGIGKGKGKIIKGKFVKFYSAKLIKNVKFVGKGNFVKIIEKIKVVSFEKNSVKLSTKDEKKRKDSFKDEKLKFFFGLKKLCLLVVQIKKFFFLKGIVIKEVKVVLKGIRFLIEEDLRVEIGKLIIFKGVNVSGKILIISLKSGVQMQKNDGSLTEKVKSSINEKENVVESKDRLVKVDFGTQLMKFMIGINKVKIKFINLF